MSVLYQPAELFVRGKFVYWIICVKAVLSVLFHIIILSTSELAISIFVNYRQSVWFSAYVHYSQAELYLDMEIRFVNTSLDLKKEIWENDFMSLGNILCDKQ